MFSIDFPNYEFSVKELSGKKAIFDVVRKKYVALTPEEIVRQYILHYLIHEKDYPKSLLAVEMSLDLNRTKKRCDIAVFKNSNPILIVECKAPTVKLNQKVFDQIARYNLVLRVPFLLVSNGALAWCCKLDLEKGSYDFINAVPKYSEL